MRMLQIAWIVGLCVVLCGCGSKAPRDNRPPVHSVRGKLLVDGKPAPDAHVVLFALSKPELAMVRPHATVGADGTFRLTTFSTNDGSPVGEFALTVTWPGPRLKTQGEDEVGPDRFRGRYAEAKRPAAKVTIAADTAELATVDLKSSDGSAGPSPKPGVEQQ